MEKRTVFVYLELFSEYIAPDRLGKNRKSYEKLQMLKESLLSYELHTVECDITKTFNAEHGDDSIFCSPVLRTIELGAGFSFVPFLLTSFISN